MASGVLFSVSPTVYVTYHGFAYPFRSTDTTRQRLVMGVPPAWPCPILVAYRWFSPDANVQALRSVSSAHGPGERPASWLSISGRPDRLFCSAVARSSRKGGSRDSTEDPTSPGATGEPGLPTRAEAQVSPRVLRRALRRAPQGPAVDRPRPTSPGGAWRSLRAGVPPVDAGKAGRGVTPFAVLRLSDRPGEGEDDQATSGNTAPPFDDANVGAAKQGDPSSWEAAYLAYARSLMGYLMVRLDNRDDAAEALSETFTRAIDKVATFRGDAYSFRAWLFSIARNVSNDQHRRRARLVVLSDHPDRDDRVQPSGEELAISHEDMAELRKGFARLPKADQEVLWLRICSGLSADDVGQVLGKKAGAVRMQQMRALGALRGQVRL